MAANKKGELPFALDSKTRDSIPCLLRVVLAEWTGLEPATPGVTGRYSNQLNYHSLAGLAPGGALPNLIVPHLLVRPPFASSVGGC